MVRKFAFCERESESCTKHVYIISVFALESICNQSTLEVQFSIRALLGERRWLSEEVL